MNEEEFNLKFGVYYPRVFGYLAKNFYFLKDIEDLCQETFLKAWKTCETYQDEGKPLAWLLTIAKNTAINEHKFRQKRDFIEPLRDYDTALRGYGSRDKNKLFEVAEILDGKLAEFEEMVFDDDILYEINNIPRGERVNFYLRHYFGLSQKEAGDLLMINPMSSATRLFRFRKRIEDLVK